MEKGKLDDVLGIRMTKKMRRAIQEKARRDAVNVAQLVRNYLEAWLAEKPPGKQGEA